MLKRPNGSGSVYRRNDGRWVASLYMPTVSGVSKRVQVYAKTQLEANTKLNKLLVQLDDNLLLPDSKPRLSTYLDYWLESIVKPNKRPKTYEQYESVVRLYLKPGLGDKRLVDLTLPMVQGFFSDLLKRTKKPRTVEVVHNVLRGVLTRAEREELVGRNVARYVELPQYVPEEVQPWSAQEMREFLTAVQNHSLHLAFLLMALYGLRRGEAVGLRWMDVDVDRAEIRIRWQLQRIGGRLTAGPVKTRASERNLPMLRSVRRGLLRHQVQCQTQDRETAGGAYVFTSSTGRPLDPSDFSRSFKRICRSHGLRIIKLHHLRHSAATLLKDAGTPSRDTQFILGHATAWTTTQVYMHDSMELRREYLSRIERKLMR